MKKENNKTKQKPSAEKKKKNTKPKAHRNEFVNLLNAVQLYEIFCSFIKLHLAHIKWLSHDLVNALLLDFHTRAYILHIAERTEMGRSQTQGCPF